MPDQLRSKEPDEAAVVDSIKHKLSARGFKIMGLLLIEWVKIREKQAEHQGE
jgi:hypothetical protein